MTKTDNENGECYIVATETRFLLADAPQVLADAGAILFRLNDPQVAEHLLELYHAEKPCHAVSIKAVPAKMLSPAKLVLANREVFQCSQLAKDMANEYDPQADPVRREIYRAVNAIKRIEEELREVIRAARTATVTEANPQAYSIEKRLLPTLARPASLQQAVDQLIYVLERHRLIFLHFAGAIRINPGNLNGPGGYFERVSMRKLPGHEKYVEEIDSNGEFLFKNRVFLDMYADTCLKEFGYGEGTRPDFEGASHPFWTMDEEGASYMQDSADALFQCVSWLREVDLRGECANLVEPSLGVAYDKEKRPLVRQHWHSLAVLSGNRRRNC